MPVLWFAIAGQIVQMSIYRTIAPSTLVSARRQLHLGKCAQRHPVCQA
jgi:hypothetical protein